MMNNEYDIIPATNSIDSSMGDDDIDTLFESMSRLASGATTPTTATGVPTPRRWTTNAHAPDVTRSLSAEDLIARLAASIAATTSHTARADRPATFIARNRLAGPLGEPRAQRTMQAPDNRIAANFQALMPHAILPIPTESIDLELYAFEALPLNLPMGSGLLLRFMLLEWDDARLDRLMVSIESRLPLGAEARTSRLLIHDGNWMWRLQVTLYLGPSLVEAQRSSAFTAASRPWRSDAHTRLLAAL